MACDPKLTADCCQRRSWLTALHDGETVCQAKSQKVDFIKPRLISDGPGHWLAAAFGYMAKHFAKTRREEKAHTLSLADTVFLRIGYWIL